MPFSINFASLQECLASFVLVAEFIAAFVAVYYYSSIKDSHWKWFVIYLVFIFIVESFSHWVLIYYVDYKKYYYNFFVIPIEFLFLFWWYTRILKNNSRLFLLFSLIYTSSCMFYLILKQNISLLTSASYLIGTLLLTFLVLMEFIKQIKSDNILNFKSNKMFYINSGIMLFYVGTLPYYAFHEILYAKSIDLWNYYGTFALVACIVMYLLFAVSFIWGKQNT